LAGTLREQGRALREHGGALREQGGAAREQGEQPRDQRSACMHFLDLGLSYLTYPRLGSEKPVYSTIARLIFVTPLNSRFGIGICFASG